LTPTDLSTGARLPAIGKLALAREVVAAYVRARRSLRRSGLRGALAELRMADPMPVPYADPVASGRRLGRIVSRLLALLPTDSRCLSQSLVLTRLLAIRGIESRLILGVQPGDSFAAHAWVEYDGVPLLSPGAGNFEELVAL
jgi:transglutaminase-like putative cysteine protease